MRFYTHSLNKEGAGMIPTSTNVSIQVKNTVPADVDAVVTFTPEGDAGSAWDGLDDSDRTGLERLRTSGALRGKTKEVIFDVVEVGRGKFRRVISVGLGRPEKLTAEIFRQCAAQAVRSLRKHRLARSAIVLPAGPLDAADAARAFVVGGLLAAFEYEEYRGAGQKKDEEPSVRQMQWTIVAHAPEVGPIKAAVERARAATDAQNFARTIASRPGNDINPPTLAKVAQDLAREADLAIRVLDEKQMQKLGMGGILAVGAGSIATPPRMIVLEYDGTSETGKTPKAFGKKQKSTGPAAGPLLVVGKSITFDSGGISIKPADRMGLMIYDKCGGMAVLGLMYALSRLKPAIRVIGILSSAENVISSKAYRPGDILRMYNGVTVDVTNTDAEGRLVLGDALAWGIETYKPSAVVDLATLTGGVVTALGRHLVGAMCNNENLLREITEASEAAGEKIWRLPLGEEQRDQIRSEHADIVNSAGREGHPLQGGAFLSYFVPDSVPWVHLDIAGPADIEKEWLYYAKGATGWGVRTLVNWVERRAAQFA